MPLDDRKRELRQLMFVAFHYLDLASEAVVTKHSAVTFGSLADKFPLSGELEEPLRERTLLSANLTSAAMRLASVDHVLRKAGDGSRRVHKDCSNYFSGDKDDIPDLRERPEWFHIMLRDVIGHAEPDDSENDQAASQEDPSNETKRALKERRKNERYEARAKYFAGTTLGWAHSRLRLTAAQLMYFLKTHYGISEPR